MAAGSPTLIMDCKPPMDCNDLEQFYSQQRQFSTGWLCYPRKGKHVAFDGQLLHGVPVEYHTGPPGLRVTFLVNIWLGHTPVGLELLPEQLLSELSTTESLQFRSRSMPQCPRRTLQPQKHTQFTARFGPENEHLIQMDRVGVPKCRRCSTFVLQGVRGAITPAEREVLSEAPTLQAGEATAEELLQLYSEHQLVVLRGAGAARAVGLELLGKLWTDHPEQLLKTWNVEDFKGQARDLSPEALLEKGRKRKRSTGATPWYVSFVLNQSEALADALEGLPWHAPPELQSVEHSKSVWFFVGANETEERIAGRNEHTDQVATF